MSVNAKPSLYKKRCSDAALSLFIRMRTHCLVYIGIRIFHPQRYLAVPIHLKIFGPQFCTYNVSFSKQNSLTQSWTTSTGPFGTSRGYLFTFVVALIIAGYCRLSMSLVTILRHSRINLINNFMKI